MRKLDQQFLDDRALRDSAKAMLLADVEHLKTGLSGKGLAERTVTRMGTGAKDALEQAADKAEDNSGILAALIGAIILWFARNPILEALGIELPAEEETELEHAEDGPSEAPVEGVPAPDLTPEEADQPPLPPIDDSTPGADDEQ